MLEPDVEKFKVVFLGDMAVGKTSLLNRFLHNTFDVRHTPTIGIDFFTKRIEYDGRTLRLQMWDTAGQERFRSLIPSYVREASVIVLVYDVSSPRSYSSLERWVRSVHEYRSKRCALVVVANKCDLERRTPPDSQEHYKIVYGHEFTSTHYVETSARDTVAVRRLFDVVASSIPRAPRPRTQERVDLSEEREEASRCRC